MHQARCSCGQLTLEAAGAPVRISVCHCLACQLRTGSAFGAQARFPKENVRTKGRATEFVRVADSGNKVIYSFCPGCGATVHYRLEQFPDVVAVPLGAFADPHFSAPAFSVYESRKHAWIDVPGPVEHSD